MDLMAHRSFSEQVDYVSLLQLRAIKGNRSYFATTLSLMKLLRSN